MPKQHLSRKQVVAIGAWLIDTDTSDWTTTIAANEIREKFDIDISGPNIRRLFKDLEIPLLPDKGGHGKIKFATRQQLHELAMCVYQLSLHISDDTTKKAVIDILNATNKGNDNEDD